MAKRTPKTTPPATGPFPVGARAIDRSRKTLDHWRNAMRAAESLHAPTRQQLYDLYADILLDDHLTAVTEQRLLAVTNTTLVFFRGDGPDEGIGKLIETEAFDQLLGYILDVRTFGYSLVQCDFTRLGPLGEPDPQIELVPRPHVVPSRGLVVYNPSDQVGIDYTRPPYTATCLAVGRPLDLGLLLKAAPLVLIKRGDVSDWAQFNEIFGQPFRVGYYNTADPGQKGQLEKSLSDMGGLAYLVLPDGARLEFPPIDRTGSVDTYERLAAFMNAAMSKLIVLQTMTTEDGASLSQSEVHERLAGDLRKADRKFVLRILNSKVRAILAAQGFNVAGGQFQFVDEEEQVGAKDQLEMDLQIHNNVGRIPKGYWAENYNVEFVDDSDEEVAPAAQQRQQEEEADDDTDEEADADTRPGRADAQENSFRGFLKTLRHFFGHAPTP